VKQCAGGFGNSGPPFLECPAVFDTEQMLALCVEFEQPFVEKSSVAKAFWFQIRFVNAGQALRLGAAEEVW
jgi:hypothetical protein